MAEPLSLPPVGTGTELLLSLLTETPLTKNNPDGMWWQDLGGNRHWHRFTKAEKEAQKRKFFEAESAEEKELKEKIREYESQKRENAVRNINDPPVIYENTSPEDAAKLSEDWRFQDEWKRQQKSKENKMLTESYMQGMYGPSQLQQSNMYTREPMIAPMPQSSPGGELPGTPQSNFQGLMPLLLASQIAQQGAQVKKSKGNKGAAAGSALGAGAGLAIGAALAPATGGMSMLMPMMGMGAGGSIGGSIGSLFD